MSETTCDLILFSGVILVTLSLGVVFTAGMVVLIIKALKPSNKIKHDRESIP